MITLFDVSKHQINYTLTKIIMKILNCMATNAIESDHVWNHSVRSLENLKYEYIAAVFFLTTYVETTTFQRNSE